MHEEDIIKGSLEFSLKYKNCPHTWSSLDDAYLYSLQVKSYPLKLPNLVPKASHDPSFSPFWIFNRVSLPCLSRESVPPPPCALFIFLKEKIPTT